MKTYKDFKELDYMELSFFAGISIEEAKDFISIHFLKWDRPITKKHKIPVEDYNFTWKTNTSMGDVNKMKMICDSYNKGVSLGKLREFGENEEYIAKGKFTGRYEVLNYILNREQYNFLKKKWYEQRV